MGSPTTEIDRSRNEDQVEVTLKQGFWMGKFEVTQGEWEQVMDTKPWSGKIYVKQGNRYPASYVSWEESVLYCQKLTEQERQARRVSSDWEFRLPTEAQWEYACRAGTTSEYSFGDNGSQLSEYAWWGGNRGDGSSGVEKYAREVGLKKANLWGLHDIHGNVWEWCFDWYGEKLPGGVDPCVNSSGLLRVDRGGSWFHTKQDCRSAVRVSYKQDYRGSSRGFRIVLVDSEPSVTLATSEHIPEKKPSDPFENTPPLTTSPSNTPAIPENDPFAGKVAGQGWDGNGLKMKFCWCPPGKFTMGSPSTEIGRYSPYEEQVTVVLSNGFWLGKYELDKSEWFKVMGTEPWKEKYDFKGGPAHNMTWADCVAFCKKLTDVEHRSGALPKNWKYSLPSEAQWEYACRAGSTSAFCFGDDGSRLDPYAWFKGNTSQNRSPEPKGQKKPNEWGFNDMHGNVGEWCLDIHQSNLPGGVDPVVIEGRGAHSYRGGRWTDSASDCRSATRATTWSYKLPGMRLAIVPIVN